MTNPSHPKNVDPATGEMTADEANKSIAKAFGIEFVADTTERDVEAIQRDMLSRVYKGNSLDELFDALQGKSSDALVGRSFEIHHVKWDVYNSNNGPLPLAKVTATDLATNVEDEWITTAPMLTVFLKRAEELKLLPFKAKITEKKTRSGQSALNFERV